jgi:phage shock protein E
MNFLKQMLGMGESSSKIKEILANGAVVVDVRSPGEFAGGHYKGSINIPLDQLSKRINDVKKYKKPVVVCCASGMRSSSAASELRKHDIEVYNGGGWTDL